MKSLAFHLGLVSCALFAVASCGDSASSSTPDAADFDANTDEGGETPDAAMSTTPNASAPDAIVRGCGDGITAGEEECDDGNDVNGDGCDNNCTPSACGNGEIDPATETCDDGIANSDTAPDACREDCTAAGCGDGILTAPEQCDDANTDDGDECGNDCTLHICDSDIEVGCTQSR
jgi:cysteine-rich repeat protein